MPRLLEFPDRAWSRLTPGPPVAPGPAVNNWVGPTLPGTRIGALLEEVWWSDSFHLSPATGLPTRIRQRPIPSAGACYPVQTHVLLGQDSEEAGGARCVYDHEKNRLVNVGDCTLSRGTLIVLTVLPQRTTAKYHHRASPGLIADAAYALTAIAAVATRNGLETTRLNRLGPEFLAALAGIPRSKSEAGEWPGAWGRTAPELALTALYLGNGPVPVLERVTSNVQAPLAPRAPAVPPDVSALAGALAAYATPSTCAASSSAPPPASSAALDVPALSSATLARRRSFSFVEMSVSASARPSTPAWSAVLRDVVAKISERDRPDGCCVHFVTAGDHELLAEGIDRSSVQDWLRHSDVLVLFTAPVSSSGAHVVGCLWWATLAAANLVFQAAAEPLRARSRPVAGWTDAQGAPDSARGSVLRNERILHGVAFWEENGAAQ